MTEVKFQWQSFDMEKSAKDFFEKYISRIDKYTKSHKISDDVLDDIHQSILEKLFEIKWEVTQKKIGKNCQFYLRAWRYFWRRSRNSSFKKQ